LLSGGVSPSTFSGAKIWQSFGNGDDGSGAWKRRLNMMDILIVDDNTDYLRLLKEALNSAGYNVLTAEDGVEGCEALTSKEIDLIISDIRMPRLDGIKLHSFAREMNRYRTTKFVFLSAYKDVYMNTLDLNPDLDYFLDKVTPADEIVKLVDQLLFGSFAGTWI
jgi:CheY-like chemotaxis protein